MTEELSLSPAETEAIVTGYHGDPFRLLGCHAHGKGAIVRAFLPQAADANLIVEDTPPLAMSRKHWDGLFELLLPNHEPPVQYQIQIVTHGGQSHLYEDPYNFGSMLSTYDEYLLAEGKHLHIYEQLGAHIIQTAETKGVRFAVWAPNARRVSVIGDFNNWDGRRHPMRFHHNSGIWELFIPGLDEGTLYKYEIKTHYRDYTVAKADPVGFASQLRPNTASVVWNINKHQWQDESWMNGRQRHNHANTPMSIYEVHLGSWQRKENGEWLTYPELAKQLIPYVKKMGFTHIELLPIAEHPYDGSWGYQVTGYFAPTSRFGTPDDFMAFVDAFHQAGIGVIVDWVPAHFPTDQHGLGFFDGTHLYEHEDPRQGAHPDWGTYIFNYGRHEVSQFLISNALFWLDKYHIDGFRVDAVASMLYLDFSRKAGEWLPNQYGGRENLHAIQFLRRFNDCVHENYPGVLTFAEESTAWPGVSHPTASGGLGFDFKWNMGWMHDTLQYMSNDPIYRAFHHGTLTFSLLYAFSENFVLPFSHDEVVHLKKSMLDKMPGDLWRKFANLRLLYGYQWTHPGKKLLFMGGEFGQWREWSEARGLDWHLLEHEAHLGLHTFMRDLNGIYGREPALSADDHSWKGFTWLDFRDSLRSILAYARTDPETGEKVIVVCNFTPVVRHDFRLGVPEAGSYVEILNSDGRQYGGSHIVNEGELVTGEVVWNEQPFSLQLTLPPLGITLLKRQITNMNAS
jgi:1,4-alpha-glucan branching enzyme